MKATFKTQWIVFQRHLLTKSPQFTHVFLLFFYLNLCMIEVSVHIKHF